MATINPVDWKRKNGKTGRSYQLDYVDADVKRHRRNFPTWKAADNERIRIESQLAAGTHIPDAKSQTVLEGARAWLDHIEALVKAGKREFTTHEQYRSHLENHVVRFPIATLKLSRLNAPACQSFVDALALELSYAMTVKVRRSLCMALSYCQRHGLIAVNPATATRIEHSDRSKVEVEIPTKTEIRAILNAAERQSNQDRGQALAMVMLGFFGGLRPSEILGLQRPNVFAAASLKSPFVRIVERLDRRKQLGPPKSAAGNRAVPIGPAGSAALRAWLARTVDRKAGNLRLPSGKPGRRVHMLFAQEDGSPISYYHFYHEIWEPLLIAAGVTRNAGTDEDPDPRAAHNPYSMRHAAASAWIEQGVKPKRLMKLMGHTSIELVMELYGHIWERIEDDAEIAAGAERVILASEDEE
ncbi:MAG TPA: tyrosine-type recombinase/integrase [Alphaproteobacteria bacterium]|nr:tyrosine-type recombinase/integrase [Alphaproteobacteria bacterium]